MLNNFSSTSANKFEECVNDEKVLTKNVPSDILGINKTRAYACFVNNSSGEITLIFGSSSTGAINKGIILKPGGGSYEINTNNLYQGKVSAISASNCKLSYVECNY
ncbi:hypothetical protein [Nostoc sp.]|uniref:hypothetical protein n=1 Tax=Nostoc sp. TaxID=1180 RepID=UPI002FF76430